MYKLSATMCVALLLGCGGNVKPVACSGIDWVDLGYTTAKSGETVRTFDKYRDGCGKNLETGALDSYLDGFTKGVIEYCTFESGYAMGALNRSVTNSCPVEVRSVFNKGYEKGQMEFKEKLRNLRRESDEAEIKGIDKGSKPMEPAAR